ncbi:RNA polymerase II transcription factor B subunit 4, partial [Linderina macrospora]
MSEAAEPEASLLVVVLDTNTAAWERCPLQFDRALQQVIIFLNAYLALKPENKLAVIATNKSECRYLYPTEFTDETTIPEMQVYEQFRDVDTKVLTGVQKMIEGGSMSGNAPAGIEQGQSQVSRALSKALCYINRGTKASANKIWPRILVVSVADDAPREYIALMNTIFAAQKLGVLIDVCKVVGGDSVFLQQAAEITGGNYLKVDTQENRESLLQSLMFTCLADHFTRSMLYSPHNDLIDFRATCFCHKRVVDIGYVCSVCLSIFCKMAPVCSTCKTKFSFKLVRAPSATNGTAAGSKKPTIESAIPKRPETGASDSLFSGTSDRFSRRWQRKGTRGTETTGRITRLDCAKSIVEQIVHSRENYEHDRYMLVSYHSATATSCIRTSLKDSRATLLRELKKLRADDKFSGGSSLTALFNQLALMRGVYDLDTYGYGRYPQLNEPVHIMWLTDGASV